MSLYTNPDDQASQDLSQIPSQIQPVYQPYMTAGNQSLTALSNQIASLLGGGQQLQGAYGSMISNPGGYVNSIGQNYQQSPGYQYQVDQGEQAVGNAAASGGYVGSPQEQQYMANTTEGIANQDFNNYLDHTMKILQMGINGGQSMYNTGFGGLQDVSHLGYSAANEYAQAIAQSLMQQANLSFASTVNQNQHNMGMLGGLAGFLKPGPSNSSGGNSAKNAAAVGTAALLM